MARKRLRAKYLRDLFATIRRDQAAADRHADATQQLRDAFKELGDGAYRVEKFLVDVETHVTTQYDVPLRVRKRYAVEADRVTVKWQKEPR